jgi:hypothetical protein
LSSVGVGTTTPPSSALRGGEYLRTVTANVSALGYSFERNCNGTKKPLPVGVEFFDEIIEKNYYYLEFKHTKRRSEAASRMADALAQIASRKYAQTAEADGYDKVICYGIGFWKKQAIAGVAT